MAPKTAGNVFTRQKPHVQVDTLPLFVYNSNTITLVEKLRMGFKPTPLFSGEHKEIRII